MNLSVTQLQNLWERAFDVFGISGDGTKEGFDIILYHYNSSERGYHSLQHIIECMLELEKIDKIDISIIKSRVDWALLVIALFYHDLVYNPKSSTNEKDSADLCCNYLNNFIGKEGSTITINHINIIYELIMFTKHLGCEGSSEITDLGKIMVDIDLSIFTKSIDRIKDYEKGVRKEYLYVPWAIYREKRREVIVMFLNKQKSGALYNTDHYARENEAIQRNFEWIIECLDKNETEEAYTNWLL